MSATPNGLEALMQQRTVGKRAKRAMPPPRHPRRQDDVAADHESTEGLAGPAVSDSAVAPDDPAVTADAATGDSAAASAAAGASAPVHDAPRPPAAQPSPQLAPARDAAGSLVAAPVVRAASFSTPSVASSRAAATGGVNVDNATAAPAATEAAGTKVKPLTVSLDEGDIDWLDDLRIIGMQHRPKIDIGRSSVLRLALRRLREQMTPEEIRDYLRERAAQAPGAPGRRRL